MKSKKHIALQVCQCFENRFLAFKPKILIVAKIHDLM